MRSKRIVTMGLIQLCKSGTPMCKNSRFTLGAQTCFSVYFILSYPKNNSANLLGYYFFY